VRREYEAAGVNTEIAAVLTESPANSRFIMATMTATHAPLPMAANWVAGEIMSLANDRNVEIDQLPVTPAHIGKLLDRIVDGTVSGKAAKQVLLALADKPGDPDEVIDRLELKQISDAGALEKAVDQVLAAQPRLVDDYRSGKEKAFNALVGQVMKATGGQANPAEAGAILRRKLDAG